MPHLGRQAGDRGALDIRRVCDHRVEPAGQRRGPASDGKLRPPADAEPLGVVAGRSGGARRDIDPDAARRRVLGQQRQQQAAGAGAEIEKAVRPVALRQPGQHGLDDRLAFGAGVERIRRQQEFEPPEFAPPDDPAQRLARQHPVQHRRDARLLRRSQQALRIRKDFGRRQVERRREQRPGAPPRLVDPGLGQRESGMFERGADRDVPAHASTAASLAARSAAVSASMISSSASPDMTLSIL